MLQKKSPGAVPVPFSCRENPTDVEPDSATRMSVLVMPSAGPPAAVKGPFVTEELDDLAVGDYGDPVGGTVLDAFYKAEGDRSEPVGLIRYDSAQGLSTI